MFCFRFSSTCNREGKNKIVKAFAKCTLSERKLKIKVLVRALYELLYDRDGISF